MSGLKRVNHLTNLKIPVEHFVYVRQTRKIMYVPTGQPYARGGVNSLFGKIDGLTPAQWIERRRATDALCYVCHLPLSSAEALTIAWHLLVVHNDRCADVALEAAIDRGRSQRGRVRSRREFDEYLRANSYEYVLAEVQRWINVIDAGLDTRRAGG